MKTSCIALLTGAALLSALISGCSTSTSDPIVATEYADNIEFLNRPAETADKGTRYRFAKELFENVNFEGVKDPKLITGYLGKPTSVTGSGSSQTLEYKFESSQGNIRAVFCVEGSKVVSAKVYGI